MNGWSRRELATIGTADEIHVAPDRADRSPAPRRADLGGSGR